MAWATVSAGASVYTIATNRKQAAVPVASRFAESGDLDPPFPGKWWKE